MRRKLAWFTAMVGAVCLTGVHLCATEDDHDGDEEFRSHFRRRQQARAPRGGGGSKEFTVSDDFQFDIGGQKMSVHDLKPGMKGTATITTTTTVTPVTVTEVRNAEVIQASGGSVLVRGQNGYRNFTQGDVEKRNITIIRDGKPVDISQLSVGDRLTATIVTEKPPKIMTEQQVQATIHPAAPGAAPAPKTPAPAASTSKSAGAPAPAASGGGAAKTTTGAGTGTGEKKTLPKTASQLPLIGATGAVCLAIAAALAVRRRRTA